MERKRKQIDYVSSFENNQKLIYIKQYLNYSIGNIETNFEVKLPLIIMVIQDCINNFNHNCNDMSMIKYIYKELFSYLKRIYSFY